MTLCAADGLPLVARSAPLEILRRQVMDIPGGAGAVIVIRGDAGIGKTSLTLAAADLARAAGVAVAVGRCSESRVRPPFAPWHEILEDLETAGGRPVRNLPPPFGCAGAVPAAWQLMQAVAGHLRRTTAARPALIVLEDLQWADQDSLDLLELVTRRIAVQPMLAVVTYRSDDLAPDGPLSRTLVALGRDRPFDLVTIEHLDAAEAAQLIESRIGPSRPELITSLHARSEGNPFFLVELIRDLSARGLLQADADGRWTSTGESADLPILLRGMLVQRLHRIGADARNLLTATAILGEEWELPVIEAMLDWPEDRLIAALEAAIGAGIVRRVPDRPDAYRFSHALFREVLVGDLVAPRLRGLHQRAAAVLASLGASRDRRYSAPARLAHHWAAAECWAEAIPCAIQAGDEARSELAAHRARRSYEQARAALDRLPGVSDDRQVLGLAERLGETCLLLNRHTEAEGEFDRMLAAARRLGDERAIGRALFWLSLIQTRQGQSVEA
ncbi:MAG TPA: AAA family ATPase, partial [Dehalococcoidia bacterium]|nr:AAA family ATPase [Dehalococcoidia bacterium]